MAHLNGSGNGNGSGDANGNANAEGCVSGGQTILTEPLRVLITGEPASSGAISPRASSPAALR